MVSVDGGGEMGSMYVLSYQIRWYIQIYVTSEFIYERSECRYVRLNALNIPHVPQPCFIAPSKVMCQCKMCSSIFVDSQR